MSESIQPGVLMSEMDNVRAAENAKKQERPDQPSSRQSDNNGDKTSVNIFQKISSFLRPK